MAKFLERNKKKGLIAALLLFFRQRKAMTLLVLVMVLASLFVATPSHVLVNLPGGTRVVAAVAWLAQKAGVDTAGWGLGGKRSFRDLMAAFRAAKSAGTSRAVGWGTFFGPAPETATNSLDMVRGSRKDLEVQSIQGVLSPEDAKAMRGGGVAVDEEQLAGGRRSLGGMLRGLFSLGGGEEAPVGADNLGSESAQSGMSSARKVDVPRTSAAGAAAGRLTARRRRELDVRNTAGSRAARSLGDRKAMTQLAEGKGRATLGTVECQPPGCPHEFAATETGAIYDGVALGGTGILSGPNDTPSVPNDDSGATDNATKLAECARAIQACESDPARKAAVDLLGDQQEQLNTYYSYPVVRSYCGDRCYCSRCPTLRSMITNLCGQMDSTVTAVEKPCSLPSYCAALGVTPPSLAGASRLTCTLGGVTCRSYSRFQALTRCPGGRVR